MLQSTECYKVLNVTEYKYILYWTTIGFLQSTKYYKIEVLYYVCCTMSCHFCNVFMFKSQILQIFHTWNTRAKTLPTPRCYKNLRRPIKITIQAGAKMWQAQDNFGLLRLHWSVGLGPFSIHRYLSLVYPLTWKKTIK